MLFWARLKISCISRICRIWNVCVHVCKTTDWLCIYCLIICNCIYIVVINCGWNNNVAVQIVACWNWNTSSWLDRHGDLVFTKHVRCESLNRRESCQIIQALSKRVCGSTNLVLSIKDNLFKQQTRTVSDLTYEG